MRLREYEYILAIARERSMVRAAQSLYISQPALSRLLQSVEAELGLALFERTGREMVLTPAGSVYVEKARQIVEMNAQLEKHMREKRQPVREVSIAYPMIRSDYFVNSVFPAFHHKLPEVSLRVSITAQGRIREHLAAADWPLALGIVTEEYAKSLSYRLIDQEEMVLAVPKGHALEKAARPSAVCTYPLVEASDLADMPFILPPEHAFSGRFAIDYFAAHGIAPQIAMRLPLTGPIAHFVAEGAGVAFVPSIPLKHMRLQDAVTYLSVQERSYSRAVGVLFRHRYALRSEEEALIEVMRQVYAAK